MSINIQPTTQYGKEQATRGDYVDAKVDAALAEISADLLLLDGTPTNAQLIQILRRAMVRQRQIIKYLAAQVT